MMSQLAASAPWQAVLGFQWNWICLTVLVYAAAVWLLHGNRRLQWLNPVLLGMAGVILILVITGIPYTTYFEGARFIHELLGPATVALAIPVARQLRRMDRGVAGFALAAALGSAASIATVWLVARGMGVSADALVPLSVKSVTMPIALTITESAGASVSLAATFVMLTGLLGSVLAQPVLRWTRLANDQTVGFALGVCAHGIGAARGFQLNEQTGAYAVLGMGVAGIVTAVGLPLVPLAIA